MKIEIPDFSLVVLVGASGSGKSTFARKHFRSTEIVSSDVCRGLVADDENDQGASAPAFEVLNFIAGKRLEGRRLAVIDATSVQAGARKSLLALARQHHALAVAIVLDVPEKVCHERNETREDRTFGKHVVRSQRTHLKRSLRGLKKEGFHRVHVLDDLADIEAAEIVRQPLWTDRRAERGPFDVIGDVHGCRSELETLLSELGYASVDGVWRHPEGRRVIFVGDLVDRGPDSPGVLRIAMGMVQAGTAFCVAGNHDDKLQRHLAGRSVKIAHGLAETIEQLETEMPDFREEVRAFLRGLVSHYVFEDGELVVAHAGLKESLQGRASARVRAFCLYGETSGEIDAYGLPVRHDWAQEYRGRGAVIYGHTPTIDPHWTNRTICIDTGCVFGGSLTAVRWPERELVSVPAEKEWCAPTRPLAAEVEAETREPDQLDIEDVTGKRSLVTRLRGRVTVDADHAAAALEVMSRFALDPRWLVYLPPTMSPVEATEDGHVLEHPTAAFAHYRKNGVDRLVCEEKHMGSRAVLVIARDAEVAARRFGCKDGRSGVIYTRTGRSFFRDDDLTKGCLIRMRAALDGAGFWAAHETDWVVLDAEILPWTAKAEDLLRTQYAAVGRAATTSLGQAVSVLDRARDRGVIDEELLQRTRERLADSEAYVDSYRRYCWKTDGLQGLKVAPFQILATEGHTHVDRDHGWHLAEIEKLRAASDGFVHGTRHLIVDLGKEEDELAGVQWWEELTASGSEGMVVKPFSGIAHANGQLLQPALKVRGREYLRIIYGPEYTRPEHLSRLRRRSVRGKRTLALREFALGVEALERFVGGEPLWRVHECVFGVLALESERVDPLL